MSATPTDLDALYHRVMNDMTDFSKGLFVVRLWDGMDGCWTDCTAAITGAAALTDWSQRTEGGTKKISFREIDYYRIFPATTRMMWNGSEGKEMFR